jgi:hypothetical protein
VGAFSRVVLAALWAPCRALSRPNWPASRSTPPSTSTRSATMPSSATPMTFLHGKRRSCLWVACPNTSRWTWRSATPGPADGDVLGPAFERRAVVFLPAQQPRGSRPSVSQGCHLYPDHSRRHGGGAPALSQQRCRLCPRLRHGSIASPRPKRWSDKDRGSASTVTSHTSVATFASVSSTSRPLTTSTTRCLQRSPWPRLSRRCSRSSWPPSTSSLAWSSSAHPGPSFGILRPSPWPS